MRINGVSTEKTKAIFPAPGKPLAFKRGEEFLAFYATPVWNMDEFHQLCPPPENEHYRFEKGGKVKDPEAPAYLEQLAIYARKRWGYLVLKSLEPSKIEWDGVSLDDPNTWVNVEEELKKHLAFYEFAKLMELVDEANALDQEKLEGNAESFFRQMSQQPAESPKSTPPVEAENS
jgi:hypothetical protein